MEEIITTALQLVIMIFVLVITRYAIPWLKSNLTATQVAVIKDWAKTIVAACEMLWPNVGEKTGDQKLKAATKQLNNIISKTGVTLSDVEIRGIIEEAVKIMNEDTEKDGE